MTTKKVVKKRSKTASYRIDSWATIRFLVTILFFILIGGGLWIGSTCSVSIGSVELTCPLGAAQVMAAAGVFIPALALGALLTILLIVLFGRAFCSWICPGRWIFNRRTQSGSRFRKYRAWIQRGLVGGVIGAAWLCHTPAFCIICPVGLSCRGAIAAGSGGSLFPIVGWLGVLVGAEWASGLSWCRDLCPLGALFTGFSRFNPFIKVEKNPEICKPCNICERSCAEGLNLAKDIDFSACTKCFECQETCPRGAVEIKLVQISVRGKDG
ncbi:MAG: 4Fe-4S binding protein [Anaerolineales bacterium]|uniref:4Fe-4S binding protein n=1 Tax=Candidatus Desulfolinea nitratireducens TaxID=2841698 RepID=A0A8J6TKF9_9CHLR|nr:4Fe-4S binding protein [Candidatus Desulfolinea nitratireducens]